MSCCEWPGLRTWVLWAALLAGAAAGPLRGVEDRVTKYKNNEVIVGTVKKAELTNVDMEVRDPRTQAVANVSLAAAEISDIEWDVADAEWRAATSAYEGAKYAQAAQGFLGIVSDPEAFDKIRLAAKAALYYYCAESLYRAGKAPEAVPLFEKLMSDFKTSYYVPRAVGSLVDALIQMKEFNKATGLLKPLRELGGEQKPLADYFEGQIMLAQGKPQDAEKLFASAAVATSVPATKGMALMGQAQCAIASNNLARGRELAQRALMAGPPASVAGAAHLTIGEAILTEIEAERPADLQGKLMDALLEFMRVLEQYKGDPRTEPQAMLKAGDCLARLSKLPNRGGDRYRAQQMYNRLINDTRYRNTRWGAQAAEAIKKL